MDKNKYFRKAFKDVAADDGTETNTGTKKFLGLSDGLPAYAYVRVSNMRGGYNTSALQQFSAIHKMALNEGYYILWDRIFYDVRGPRGLFERPGIKSLLHELRKQENNGSVILVNGLGELSSEGDELKQLGKLCLETNTDVMVCLKGGYLLSIIMRIFSQDTPMEEKLALVQALGWDKYIQF